MQSEFTLGLPRGGGWKARSLGAWLDSSAVLAHDGCILYFFGAVGTRLHDVVLTVCASAPSTSPSPTGPRHPPTGSALTYFRLFYEFEKITGEVSGRQPL